MRDESTARGGAGRGKVLLTAVNGRAPARRAQSSPLRFPFPIMNRIGNTDSLYFLNVLPPPSFGGAPPPGMFDGGRMTVGMETSRKV